MKTMANLVQICLLGALLLLPVVVQAQLTTSRSNVSQMLRGHVPDVVKSVHPLGNFPAANRLNLAISLPLRNREVLTNLLQQIYDPTSPNYRHYLTPQQFTEQFGPTETDYAAVMNFAKARGLTVSGTHPNRTLLDVSGTVADIEKAFHITLRIYQHPTEARTFYAPDSEPSVDLAVPILEVAGLNDYVLPRPMYHHMSIPNAQSIDGKPAEGSGSYGTYMGNDFRAAYVPGVSLTGAGQNVGLFELDGYYTNDPDLYASQAGFTNAFAITNVLVDGFDGTPGSYNVEVALDIEMVMSMAPGAKVMVYEGSTATPTIVIDILNRMANDDVAQELSSSWTFGTGPSMEQAFQQMDAQGQSFFNCSGDHDAYSGSVTTPADDPYITIVGGTILSTSGAGSNWVSETAWNRGDDVGSGGGISTVWAIPSWQQAINMSGNQGSATMRNLPDVAMVAEAVYAVADNGTPEYLGGTSVATPLWAAFMALVNQQAAQQGKPMVGFVNPALYAIGQGANYNTAFHDVITGNNTNASSPNNFSAVPGYDLCTGWGSPTTNLIDALLNVQFVVPNGWTLTSLPNEDWTGVASSADGTQLIAADLSGGHQINVSSSGGATWRSYGPAASWRGLASSADGTKLAAAAWDGPIYTSVNSGVTWTATASPTNSWRSIASSADGTKLAAGAFGENVVEVSTNSGANWRAATGAPSGGLVLVAWSADGSVLVAAHGSVVYVSTNSGVTGISQTLPGMNFTSVASSADGTILYAAGGSIYTSTNRGTSWIICGSLSGAGLVACSTDGYRVAAASDQVYLSDDEGASWMRTGPRTAPYNGNWSTIACSSDGIRLIAAISDYYDGPVYTGVFPRSGPIITTPPSNQAAIIGSNAVFSMVAIGPPPLTYQWSFNGTNIPSATHSSLILTNVQLGQAGYYSVQVNDAFGSRYSPNASLTVLPPPASILVQPTNQTAVLGTTVSFAVTALGTPPLSYQWMFNGTNIAGATNSLLMMVNVQPTNAGIYAVTVANGYGPVTSSNALLTLISSTPCLQPPSGLVGWWPAEGDATDRVGTNNGTLVGNVTFTSGEDGQCFGLDGNTGAITLANNPYLQLPGLTIEMWIKRSSATLSSQSGGKAFLFAFGGEGFGLFDNGTLFWQFNIGYGSGGVINDTNWHHVAVTVTSGGDTIYIDGKTTGSSGAPQGVTFTDVAIGARGDNLASGFYGAIDEVALYNQVLSASEIQAIYNAGVYGKCWMPAPPFILTQPNGQTIIAGQSATFTVAIAGWLQAAGYQWQFNGANMTGMTNSSLTIPNAQWNQAGNYAVVITNAYGLVNSANAILVVQETNKPVFKSMLVLSNGVVQGMVSGNAGPTYIEASTNLVNWVMVTNLILTNANVLFTDSFATNYPQRFYRARIP